MHSKVRLFFALCAMFSFVFLQAQDRDEAATPISKGSIIIGGAVSFASQGGDLYANGDDRQNTLSFMPNALFFVADNIAVGGQLNFTRAWQGDVSSTQFGIGPTAGYFLDVDSSIYPYGAVGLSYQNLSIDSNFADESINGFQYRIGAGILTQIKQAGITVELAFVGDSFSPEDGDSISGNTIQLSVGVVGLIFGN
jgi:hypothetical protein